jgi:uncharacterized protein (UPF0333 family)
MSLALITVIALVIAAVTGVKIYLENKEVKAEGSTTVTLPSETKAEEAIAVNEPVAAPAINEVKAPITDKTVDAPIEVVNKPKLAKKPFKKKSYKPKPAAK